MVLSQVKDMVSRFGNYAKVMETDRGLIVSLFEFKTDFGYGDVQSNSDEVEETVKKLEKRFSLITGDENPEIDSFVRNVLELPEDDFTIGDERIYRTMLVEV